MGCILTKIVVYVRNSIDNRGVNRGSCPDFQMEIQENLPANEKPPILCGTPVAEPGRFAKLVFSRLM
jgi:hypothetical protein